ncbi:MAG TPA: hypothetical protein VGD26_08765, partial [Chitinophagaceae bacterium]
LKITGPNRAVVYSNIKPVDFAGSTYITISPNPVVNVAKLYVEHNAECAGELLIIDAGGGQVLKQDLNIRKGINQFDVPIDGRLSNGVYQAIILINNKPYIFKLLVKK